MFRRFVLIGIVAAFFVGALIGAKFFGSSIGAPVVPTRYVDLTLQGAIKKDLGDFRADELEHVRITRVIDGDTVELSDGERLRLIGVDSPERGSCFADEAADILETFVLGKTLRFEEGVNERDRYGRRLGYLYDGSLFVNKELVRRGGAIAKAYPPDIVHAALLDAAEDVARNAKRGVWGLCGGVQPVSVVDPETDAQPPPSAGCAVKGNISSEGERIYHLPGCGSYEKTKIDVRGGERWFCDEGEAQAAGWRKAGNCP